MAAALAGALGLALTPTMALATPDQGTQGTFNSSFEASETTQVPPSTTYDGELKNLTGSTFNDSSLLPQIKQVSASGENPPDEVAKAAADGNSSTKWLTKASAGSLTYAFATGLQVTSYTLTSANDSPGRDPKDFSLQGSNDGSTWDTIDSRTGQTWKTSSNDNRFTTKTYTLSSRSAAYTYYRLNITANNGDSMIQLADWDLLDSQTTASPTPMTTVVDSGPTSSDTAKTGVGFTGLQALRYGGHQVAAGEASATNTLFTSVGTQISKGMRLSYKVFPVLDPNITYSATHVAVDLVTTDGTRLSTTGATDAYGYPATAKGQGDADILWPNQWNSVNIDLDSLAGKTVKDIVLTYDNPDGAAGTPFSGWLDDVAIAPTPVRDTTDGLVSYVDTRRGTNSTGGYSRGNNLPATAWPNGFNFITPMTNADNTGTLYNYQRSNNAQNRPTLNGIGFSHEPSIWMGDRDQLALMPADGDSPTSDLNDRKLAFGHDQETARPDIYSVTFDNGLSTKVTPTDHGAVFRFSFTGNKGSVLVDQLVDSSKLSVAADGTVSGWVDGGSSYPGRTRMFIYGSFDHTPTAAGNTPRGNRSSARYAAFDTSTDKTIELRLSSSFISADQAKHNFDLELNGVTFDQAHAAAMSAWNARLGVVTDVKGATDTQLVTLYSGLYRLNLYPNSQSENTGTAQAPKYQYASPVTATVGNATDTQTNAVVKDGQMYVNNGFWDTYRTAWPAIATFYPDLAPKLVDGFVQQYRDGGWIARWSSPGYADLMTGTSSDVAFAEAYMDGSLDTDTALQAFDAAVKNATAEPASSAVGRKGLETSAYLGFTPASVHQSASWGLEGFINDFGIAEMAAKLADDPQVPADRIQELKDDATYFGARSKHYVEMFNPLAHVFTARNADGTWPDGADFNKEAWGGAFTEASGWTFAFHAPFDVDGMASLYGGRQALVDEIHQFLNTQERAAYSGIHEAKEARDVRLGMLGMSNQVAHHIPYVLAEAGDPSGAQQLIRTITQRLFAGSDIGQGYPGDEDNGEMSAWYLFSALGFYPLEVGSGNYTIGSPLFDSATVHMGSKTLTIKAPGASESKVYVGGVSINGKPVTTTTFDGSLLRAGGTMEFTMSDSPTSWGAKDMNEKLTVPATMVDATETGNGVLSAQDGTAVTALSDDNMLTSTVFPSDSATLTWKSSSGAVTLDQYTLSSTTDSDAAAPSSWTLEGSLDGTTWTTLDTRAGESFPFGTQVRPFSVPGKPGAYTSYRLTAHSASGTRLGLSELELFANPGGADKMSMFGADAATAQVGQEYSASLATLVGPDTDASSYTVLVSMGDGSAPVQGTLTANGLGGWKVSAPHTFDRAGTYTVTVSATDSNGSAASATTSIDVTRDETLAGSLNNTCIADSTHGASCDGQGSGLKRNDIEGAGFVPGTTLDLKNGTTADLPAVKPGDPDNVTDEGQTIAVNLGKGATKISFVGTSTETKKALNATLTFSDGSTQVVPLAFGDWVGDAQSPVTGNTAIATSNGRLIGTNPESSIKVSAIFASTPVVLDTDATGAPKTVVSITLPTENGTLRDVGRVHLFAIGSDGDRSGKSMTLTAGTDITAETGASTTPTLATVNDATAGASLTATVNWGDGTQVSDAQVVDGAVKAEHTYATAGTYSVNVTVDDGVKSVSTALKATVTAPAALTPTLTVATDTVAPGQSVGITGAGFKAGEDVTLAFVGSTTTVKADAKGAFTTSVTVPTDASDGQLTITATGVTSGAQAVGTVSVVVPQVQPAATTLDLSASNTTATLGESFQLTAKVSPAGADGMVAFMEGSEPVGSASVSAGVAVVDVRVSTPGDHTYTAVFTPTDPSAFGASTSKAVTVTVNAAPAGKASLTLSSPALKRGETLGITGTGFTAGEKVRVTLDSQAMTLATVNADANGSFAVTVTVPAQASTGGHEITAEGLTSGLSAKSHFEVLDQGVPEAGSSNGGSISTMPLTGAVGLGIVTVAAATLLALGLFLRRQHRRSQS